MGRGSRITQGWPSLGLQFQAFLAMLAVDSCAMALLGQAPAPMRAGGGGGQHERVGLEVGASGATHLAVACRDMPPGCRRPMLGGAFRCSPFIESRFASLLTGLAGAHRSVPQASDVKLRSGGRRGGGLQEKICKGRPNPLDPSFHLTSICVRTLMNGALLTGGREERKEEEWVML